ncbi:hypothetical protein YT61_000912 [Salmonella enterica subsp. enterica]|nr:hypothetical protein [Salmonella enterica]EDR1105492.1 hypothetical protein [Salmonella enterica subsp. enterica serovar Fluntern]EDV0191458.1 hypothetical protein [Salmonella enterica subsp. enterica]EAZ9124866.1 hypothetical protein [Salmonella enterica]EBA0795352.1 hypothetical protein [Salmonella enterica]
MKRFKEIAAILHCWPRGSRRRLWHRRAVVVARGILIFRVHGFFVSCNNLILCNYRHLLVSIAGINKSIQFQ